MKFFFVATIRSTQERKIQTPFQMNLLRILQYYVKGTSLLLRVRFPAFWIYLHKYYFTFANSTRSKKDFFVFLLEGPFRLQLLHWKWESCAVQKRWGVTCRRFSFCLFLMQKSIQADLRTLQWTNISHLGKRIFIFKRALVVGIC